MKKLPLLLLALMGCHGTVTPGPLPTPTPSPIVSPTPTATPQPSIPSQTRHLLYGYYFEDGRYGDFRSEVACFTNLYIAWARRGYEPTGESTDDEWLPLMKQGLKSAFNKGRRIYLSLNLQDTGNRQTPIDRVLDVATSVWANVDLIELADEPGWTKSETESKVSDIKSRLKSRGLRVPPIGVVYTQSQVLNENAIDATGLDWVGLEGYVDPPGSPDSKVNVDKLNNFFKKAKARVSKNLVIVMQAYTRNGAWTNIQTLKDLQEPSYLAAKDDPRVLALTMFSYGRPSGTRENPSLKNRHIKFGNEILGSSCQ